jgi:Trk K+ transport system NAD-binding subunit
MLPPHADIVLAAGDRLILVGDGASVDAQRDEFDPW